jgi:hypothetical protein
MTEVLFYHLQNMSLESVLPPLLEKSLERGWRVVVQSTSQERADALDAHLWTYRDDSFCRTPPGAPAMRRISRSCCWWRRAIRTGQCQVSDRQCRLACGFAAMIGWFWSSTATTARRSLGARSLDRLQGAGVRGHLLAGRRAGPVAAAGIAISAINDNLQFLLRACTVTVVPQSDGGTSA